MSAKGPVIDGVQVALPVRVDRDRTAAGDDVQQPRQAPKGDAPCRNHRVAVGRAALWESALVRLVSAYGETPEFVLLGGLVPDLLCGDAARQHVGTTDVDVQVDLEIQGGSTNAPRLERRRESADSHHHTITRGGGRTQPSPAPS